jgi:hypothetical protein
MSKITKIRTKLEIATIDICKRLVEIDGYGIALKDDAPTAKIYMPHISIREVEITKEAYGYEVRLTTLACRKDYELYRDTIKHILTMTKGKAVYEEGSKISDATIFFDERFIRQNLKSEFNVIVSLANDGHEIAICCPFRDFYIGTKMIQKVKTYSTIEDEQQEFLFSLIRKSQYEYVDQLNTPRFGITMDADNDEGQQTLTVYRQNEYGYISGASYFSLMQPDDDFVIIRYDDLHKIVPPNWELIDEKQYRTTDISDCEWRVFWDKAKQYEIQK